ncbi:MAG: hypothetical protein C0499_09225 [Zymomonas sp.]|nr:hypothetical protein [Zymomonas sp.]
MGQQHMFKQVTGFAVVLALAACGGEKAERTITTSDGSTLSVKKGDRAGEAKITATNAEGSATMTTGGAGQWPTAAAGYVPPYPGGVVTASFAGSSKEASGGMVTFTTSDSPDKVVEFYKAQAASAGLGDVSNIDINGAKIFAAKDKATGRSVSIQATVSEGRTSAAVTFGTDKK